MSRIYLAVALFLLSGALSRADHGCAEELAAIEAIARFELDEFYRVDQPSSVRAELRSSLEAKLDQLAERSGRSTDDVQRSVREAKRRLLFSPTPTVVARPDARRVEEEQLVRFVPFKTIDLAAQIAPDGPNYDVRFLGLSPDGTRMLVHTGENLRIWHGGKSEVLSPGAAEAWSHFRFSGDSQWLLGLSDVRRAIDLWELETWTYRSIEVGRKEFLSGAFSPNGDFLVAGLRRELYSFRLGNHPNGGVSRNYQNLSALDCGPQDWMLATGSTDGAVRIIDLEYLGRDRDLKKDGPPITIVRFSPDGGRVAIGSVNGLFQIMNLGAGSALTPIESHSQFISDLAFSSDGKHLIAGETTGRVTIWNVSNGITVFSAELSAPILSVGFSADNRLAVVATSRGEVAVWKDICAAQK